MTVGSQEFHQARALIGELHDKKQRDYGTSSDPFANIRQAERWGLPASLGACIRIGDKVSRLQTFYAKGELACESVEDAFLDLAVYALIGYCLVREEFEAGEPESGPVESLRQELQGPHARATCVLCHGFLRNHVDGKCPDRPLSVRLPDAD